MKFKLIILITTLMIGSAFAQIDVWRSNTNWGATNGLTWTTTGADSLTSDPFLFEKEDFNGALTVAVEVDITAGSGKVSFELQSYDGIRWNSSGVLTFNKASDYSTTTTTFEAAQEGASWHYGMNVVSASSASLDTSIRYRFRILVRSDAAVTADIKTIVTPY